MVNKKTAHGPSFPRMKKEVDLDYTRGCSGVIPQRYRGIGLRAMDVPVLLHLGIVGILIVPFHHGVRHWPWIPPVHAALLLLLLETIRLNSGRRNGLLEFVRTFYPVLWISFAWKEAGLIATMIFPYWANGLVVNADLWIFGVHPTVWVQTIFRPWLTELMNFFYFIYYFFIPAAAFPLYFGGRRRNAEDFLFLVTLTFAVSFVLFLIFPAEGAWVILKNLHTVEPKGGFFLSLIQAIQAKGTIPAGAFPSSHVAAAFVMALGALKFNRPAGWVLLPLAAGVAAATVYCRYHHAVDAIAGILLGLGMYAAGIRILERRGRS
jgi:membrane-associated phospholipid phosphatase